MRGSERDQRSEPMRQVSCASRVRDARPVARWQIGIQTRPMDAPETRYARSADVMIAYQVVGDGPFDVVLTPGTVSHVELYWDIAGIAALLRGIAEHARLIFFDKRGTGLSDRVTGAPTLEERSDDIRAVMDTAGSKRAVLFGASEGVPMSVVFAASHPERVSALVLYGGNARERWAPDYLFGSTERGDRLMIEQNYELFLTTEGIEELVRSGMPSADESEVQAWARVFRYGASPASFEALDRMNMVIDVRAVLPVVRAPTLVVHQRADPWVSVEHGRYLAEHIPGATFAELDGDEHLPSTAFAPRLLSQVMPFMQEVVSREAAPEQDSVLATVLFSDIVSSTALAAELGDVRWRQLLGEHHTRVRRQLNRFRGVEIDTVGDGFFASFDGPARAIRCAEAIRDAVGEIGLQVRLGLHTGECEILDGKVAGIAVAIGARVSACAAAGEVLVSQTVKDLVTGSGIGFDDRGPANLKGVPGQWRLYAVTSS
jgi:class 3 adenylate cyclase